jgi:hypothetical protein
MAEATKGFEELLECLTRQGVRFVVVGAHAVAHHAKPRYTKDLADLEMLKQARK